MLYVRFSAPRNSDPAIRWTTVNCIQSVSLFVLAAAVEVMGGWLVWQSIRKGKPWFWAFSGSFALFLYGFVPTFQPVSHFGRIYAVYGGFFIVYSYGWGWLLDKERPDVGDFAGAGVALSGVCLCWFWPRKLRVD